MSTDSTVIGSKINLIIQFSCLMPEGMAQKVVQHTSHHFLCCIARLTLCLLLSHNIYLETLEHLKCQTSNIEQEERKLFKYLEDL